MGWEDAGQDKSYLRRGGFWSTLPFFVDLRLTLFPPFAPVGEKSADPLSIDDADPIAIS
jgi:hypothetical protein